MKQKFTFLMMLILLIAGSSFSQDKQDWKWMHPTSNNNILRKVKMISESNWVANGANGTFMHTANSGANWYFQNFVGKVNSATLATDQTYDSWFFNAKEGIVVGNQGYIGRTTDAGVTFDTAGTGLVPTNSRNWSIWFADENTGFIGSGSQNAFTTRILKTTNAGVNWSVVYVDASGSTSYLTSLGGYGNTICASWQNGSCVRSSDAGATWTVIPSSFPSGSLVNGIEFLNSTTGFAAGSAGTFSRTTDGGLTWTSLGTTQVDWSYFQVKVVSATEIYVVGDPTYLYRSSDMGNTWTPLAVNVTGPAVTFVWYSLDHFGSTYTLSGDYGQVAVSTDGCLTWTTPGYTQLSNSLLNDITTVSGTSKYWAVGRAFPNGGSNKQILYSSNSGSSWTTQNAGITADFTSISMINENTGYISGTNNKVMKTTDGGSSWIAKTGPSPVSTSQLYTCDFIDENTGWVFVNFSTVAGGNVFKTVDGGDTWSQYSTGATSENIYSAEMVDANTGFAVMNQSNRPIYRTTNGGVNWTGATTTGFTGSIRGISSPDGITVYACQTSGTSRVAKSVNGGVNWTLITLPAAVDANSIDFKDVNTGYVSGNTSGIICRTSDGGTTWTFQNTHTITGIKVFVSQGDTAWNVGGNTSIMRYTGVSSKINLNLTAISQAMYNSGSNTSVRSEPATVSLRSSAFPYQIIESASGVLDNSSFSGSFSFTNTPTGSYFIEISTINCLETWSSSAVAMTANGPTVFYDFTSANTQAYGNNLALEGTKWCIISGDVNQDGIVDGADLSDVENNQGQGGDSLPIYAADVNGDGYVDASDIAWVENNLGLLAVIP
jgi:photosystem II stability/assembly factor-like uncharacterized protein